MPAESWWLVPPSPDLPTDLPIIALKHPVIACAGMLWEFSTPLDATRGRRRFCLAPSPKIGISVAAVGRVCWEVATVIAMKPPDRNNQVLA